MSKVTLAEARPRMKPLSAGGVRCPRCLNEARGFWSLPVPDECGALSAMCAREPARVSTLTTDQDRHRMMQALGARWPKRSACPTYSAKMAPWQKAEADAHYDAMSQEFCDSFGMAFREANRINKEVPVHA